MILYFYEKVSKHKASKHKASQHQASQHKPKLAQKKVYYFLNGPILFTAPHSKRLYRGGPKYDQEVRVHECEKITAWIASQLATLTALTKKQPNSFVVWDKSSPIDDNDIDPNYMLEEMFKDSQFHLSLHAWGLKNSTKPILHVDVHGKTNRQKNCQIDIGIRSMIVYWKNDPLIKQFHTFFEEKHKNMFEGIKFRQFTCTFNTNPMLHGYWGAEMMTMTQQAISLGIPSFQVQIPLQVREAMFQKPELVEKFAASIKQFYIQILVPYHSKNKRELKLLKELALKFQITAKTEKQLEQVQGQIKQIQSDPNAIKISLQTYKIKTNHNQIARINKFFYYYFFQQQLFKLSNKFNDL